MKPVTMQYVEETRDKILQTMTARNLTHEQKVMELARQADTLVDVLDVPPELAGLMQAMEIDDLNEGHAPYRPRYILPDYSVLLEKGCAFLRLAPPRDIWELTNALLILYKHVPSVSNFPVFVGNLDELFEPFIRDENEARRAIGLFLDHMDRTISDAFCHGDIGPKATRAGLLIMEVCAAQRNVLPNLSLRYDPAQTSDEFALQAIQTALQVARPSFANDVAYRKDYGGKYAIASCYNALKIGGGGYTLMRLLLGNIAKRAAGTEDFFARVLPQVLDVFAAFMDARIRFAVEESGFFESNFLVKEGFIARENFTAMFGVVGLAECVNRLLEKDGVGGRFGSSEQAMALGLRVMDALQAYNDAYAAPYCEVSGGHFVLHAQVGIGGDGDSTPGTRIPVGDEPDNLMDHVLWSGRFDPYFTAGTGELYPVDTTANRNPAFLLDIIKGAFQTGSRYLSFYASDSDLIRVTGYLAKRSEIEKWEGGQAVQHGTHIFAAEDAPTHKSFSRKAR